MSDVLLIEAAEGLVDADELERAGYRPARATSIEEGAALYRELFGMQEADRPTAADSRGAGSAADEPPAAGPPSTGPQRLLRGGKEDG